MQSSDVVKVAVLAGTRPEIIKLAPVIKAVQAHKGMEVLIIHTGQHRDLGRDAWSWFGISPHYDLAVMEENQALDVLTGRMLQLISPVLDAEKPACVVVQGDTSSAFAGAMSAFLHKIPVAHVEAGLRTYQQYAPFPEEINRVLISRLAQWHFAPTPQAREQLIQEGFTDDRIWTTGNTIVDSLNDFVDTKMAANTQSYFQKWPRLVLVTLHRRENQGEALFQLIEALNTLSSRADIHIRFVTHPAPFLQKNISQLLNTAHNLECVPPIAYPLFLQWLQAAFLIITDSGGIQEEAAVLGKPVVLLRQTTERAEAVNNGTVRLVEPSARAIIEEVLELFGNESYYFQRCQSSSIYGTGNAAKQIVEVIYAHFSSH